jgi:putative ABC transport system permease protein
MDVAESLRIALRMLGANKVRSSLTMLGVVVGVAVVILLVSIGSGVKSSVSGQLENLGSNLIFVFPGSLNSFGPGSGLGGGSFSVRKDVTQAEVDLLARRLGPAAVVVPVLQAPVLMRVGNVTYNANMAAGSEQGAQVFTATLLGGRHYSRAEWDSGARVVALGSNVRATLFPNVDPVGRKVDIEGQPFTVVGYYAPQGGSLSGSQDRQIYLPSTTGQRLLGVKKLSEIVIKAEDPGQVDAIRTQVEMALRPRFGTEVTVLTQRQTLGVVSSLLSTLTAMLAGLAGISLIVGGIGIMNIMLVSVSERTREIGIRKAVGAKTSDILSQFVVESVLLSAGGGVLGVALGVAVGLIARRWVPVDITAWSILLAFLFSAVVGLFFGVYPAYQASRLDPIEALRHE